MEKNERAFNLQWHITEECDQRCQHCYIFRNKENGRLVPEVSFENKSRILDDFLEFCRKVERRPVITLTGGDPLLSPDFWKLSALLKNHGLYYSILGNPFHLDDEICARLFGDGCAIYQISLDGMEETHDAIRRKGSFRRSLEGLRALKKSGIYTAAMATASKMNQHDFPELIRLVADEGIDCFAFARYSPTKDDRLDMFTPSEYRDFLERIWQAYNENVERGTVFFFKDHLWKLFLYEKGLFKPDPENDLIVEGCGCGIRHMSIKPNGDVYSCVRFDSKVGNALESSFEGIFFGGTMDYYRQVEKFEECNECELFNYCRGCHAVSYGACGNFFAKDPQCWR